VDTPGYVPDADLPALYSGALCLITASRYEGFGLPALEALACGTPVVAYDAGAIPEVAGPGALLAPAGDPAALMAAAGRICDEPELRAKLSEAGRRHAAGFSWRAAAEATWDVYESVATLPRP
jgi:alpha-1,3-rhamnosyl/mannosyltransferase